MAEVYAALNPYTLRVVEEEKRTLDNYGSQYMTHLSSITRTFNFLAAQVETVTRDLLYQSHGSERGGAASVATLSRVEGFDELPSTAEVRYMHEKLKSLGGTPPALEETLGGFKKQLKPVGP